MLEKMSLALDSWSGFQTKPDAATLNTVMISELQIRSGITIGCLSFQWIKSPPCLSIIDRWHNGGFSLLGEVFKTSLGGRWQVISIHPCPPSKQTLDFLAVRYPWSGLPTPLRTFSYNLEQVVNWCGLSDLPPKSSLLPVALQDAATSAATSELLDGTSSQALDLESWMFRGRGMLSCRYFWVYGSKDCIS